MAAEERLESAPPLALATRVGAGAQLQAAREAAGLSLDQVAQQLKLAPRQVRALEEEDFAQLPGRTFARGFVRNYARLLNLDGDDLLALLPDTAHAPSLEAPPLQSTGAMIAVLPSASVAQPGFSRWVIPFVLVACIVGAAAYEWYRGGLAQPSDAPKSVAPAPGATAPVTTSSTELPNRLGAETGSTAPSAPPAASEASTEPVAAPVAAAAEAAPVAAGAAPLQLRYHGPSWTDIRDRDGQVLVSRLVAAGSEQAIRGNGPFDIVIGNARAVTLVHRGTPVDLSRYTRQNVARLRLG
jgi:cytoskeleton protein RodZ